MKPHAEGVTADRAFHCKSGTGPGKIGEKRQDTGRTDSEE